MQAIINIVLQVVTNIINDIINFLPDSSGFPAGVQDSLDYFFTVAYSFNSIFPIDTLLDLLILTVAFQGAVFLFKTFNWTLNKLRGSG